ncbi:MAG: alpha/beta hydrolase [Desulfobacteraceae bacterium]|jgi:pimeloyl-ACP methyl ester carboxylesterase|nr:alpha/beta hydrolase [Desulfobacteraceae bacterium]
MTVEKEVINIDGIPVNMTRQEGKPLIILTRMASQAMGIWDTIWGDFARYFTVANFDLQGLPGARRRDAPGEGFRLLAENCVQVAAFLGFEKFHIFGWNGGTQIAMRCAVNFADHIQSCILLDPFFELADMRKVNKAIEFKRVLFEHPQRELYAYYWVMAGLSSGFIGQHFDQVEKMVAARMKGDKFVKTDPDVFINWVRALRRNWITDEEFGRIRAPTLVMATELDNWHAGPSVSMAREVCDRIPNAELQIIEGFGGHFLVEDPAKFMEIAEPFIRSIVA